MLAWQIAAAEAGHGKWRYIEHEHLLIGPCTLEKALVLGALRQELDEWVARKYETAVEDADRLALRLDHLQQRL